MSEAELDAAISGLCDELHLVSLHVRDVRREDPHWKGFPDRMIFGPGGVLYRELKAPGARVRAAQQQWHRRLSRAGQDVAVWKPADWHAGRIRAELERLAAGEPDQPETPRQAFYKLLYGTD